MTPEPNDYEIFSCNSFMANGVLSSRFDPDFNFSQNISSLDTDYFLLHKVKDSISNPDENSF